MALSDHEYQKRYKPKKRAFDAGNGVRWSDSQKLEAVQSYLMLGTVRLTSATLKIPEQTLKLWRTSSWWKDLESELKIQDELQLSARLKNIVEKSFSVVEDRLEHGNYVFDQKTGKLKRVPVNLKDAHKVAVDSLVQKDMIAKHHVEKANDGQIEDKLLKLAEKFAEMAANRFSQIKDEERTIDAPVDVQDVNVVQEEDDFEDSDYDEDESERKPDAIMGDGVEEYGVIVPYSAKPLTKTKLELLIEDSAHLSSRRKEAQRLEELARPIPTPAIVYVEPPAEPKEYINPSAPAKVKKTKLEYRVEDMSVLQARAKET